MRDTRAVPPLSRDGTAMRRQPNETVRVVGYLVPKAIAKYSLSSTVDGLLAKTCDM